MKQNISYKELKNKGFTLVEIVVIIAIMIVLLAILTPSILRYVENSRMQKDDSAMDEVCHGVLLALSDSEIFDEAVSYAIPNNYVTYTDSSGVYAAKYVDEEFWAPDGSGNAVTITFNPDENGTYVLANGLVNDMTYGNGSVADTRTADGLKQCYFSEMGQQKLYHKVAQTIGETFSEKSATYKNSSYTVFITFDVVNGIKRADVYGEWNGTNLDENCPASLGSGTNSYTEDEEPEQTKTGGTTQSNYTSSDLTGTGGTSGCPSYKPCAHPTWILKDADNEFHQCETCLKEETHEFKNLSCIKCGFTKPHRCETFVDGICPECGLNKPIAFEITHTNYHMAGIVREGHVVIPDRFVYEGVQYEVTGIGKIAFDNCPELLSVYIPDTVTYIEYPRSSGEHWGGAFSNCPKLESVRMSPNIKGTLRGTFYQCKSLKSMVIPDGVTSLYWYTFSGCRSLESLTLGKSVKSMQSDVVSGTKIKTINIPSTMRTLFGYALTGAPFDYITYDGTMNNGTLSKKVLLIFTFMSP